MDKIEQIKNYIIDRLQFALRSMYEKHHTDSMHSVWHGEVLCLQDMLAYITMITTEVKENK